MADSTILDLTTRVNFAPIKAGMDEIASAVKGGTASMGASFEALGTTVASSTARMTTTLSEIPTAMVEATSVTEAGTAAMADSMLLLTAAVQRLTTQIATIPVKTRVSVEETRGALTLLEEKLVETAETGKLSAAGIGGAFSGLSALLGAGLLVGFAASFVDASAKAVIELGHLSEKTGIAIDTLSGLQLAAREVGVDFESITQGMIRLERAQELAVEGGKSQELAFKRLGISMEEVKSSTPEEILNKISEAIQKSGSSASTAASAITLLGRGGAALIPIFKEYGGNLLEVADNLAKNTGVTQESYEESLKLQKMTALLSAELRKLAIEVLPLFTVVIPKVIDGFQRLALVVAELGADAIAILNPFLDTNETIKKLSEISDRAAVELAKLDAQFASLQTKKIEGDEFGIHGLLADLGLLRADTPDPSAVIGKVAEQAAAYKQGLEQQLAALSAFISGQKVLYAEGKITISDWINQLNQATTQAAAGQELYFARLRALYANDPLKIAAINAEQAKQAYQELAKAQDELAAGLLKLKEDASSEIRGADKEQLAEQEKTIKDISAATLDWLHANEALIASQKSLDEVQRAGALEGREETIKAQLAMGLINQRDANRQFEELYREDAMARLAILNDALLQEQSQEKVAQENLAAAVASGYQSRILVAKAALLQIQTAETKTVTDIEKLWSDLTKKITDAQVKQGSSSEMVLNSTLKRMQSAINSTAGMILSGQEPALVALQRLWQNMAATAVQSLMRIAEQMIIGALLHKTVAKDEQFTAAKVAASNTYASVSAIPVIGWALAPIAAAAAFVAVLAFDQGGLVPRTGMGMLHEGERVATPDMWDEITDSKKSSGASFSYVDKRNFSALDAAGMSSVLARNKDDVAKHIRGLIASGRLDLGRM